MGACGNVIAADTGQWKMKEEDGEELWGITERKINETGNASNNIAVIVRVRPFNGREKALNTYNCIEMKAEDPENHQCWIYDPEEKLKDENAAPSKFRFDYCFDSFKPGAPNFVNQEQVFRAVGLDVLAKAWTGFNACLFAYGQTGSGKTYSVMGYGGDKGIIPRICEALFYFIERTKTPEKFKVDACYLEVYNEMIMDLLVPKQKEAELFILSPKERMKMEDKLKKLIKTNAPEEEIHKIRCMLDPSAAKKDEEANAPKIYEDPVKGVVVGGLKHFAVTSFDDCEKLLDEGLGNRTVGSTAMNASSSRSHCVFTVELTQLEKKASSKITLVDLAGSEKTQTAKTEGQGLLEGININKSLSCLGQCIGALAKAAMKKDAEEAKKTPEQREAEAMAAKEAAEKKRIKEEKAKKKAAAKADSKFGMKTGAPAKSIEKTGDFIPFRDSVLTWILRDSLCGNSKTVMLAALSPAAANYQVE